MHHFGLTAHAKYDTHGLAGARLPAASRGQGVVSGVTGERQINSVEQTAAAGADRRDLDCGHFALNRLCGDSGKIGVFPSAQPARQNRKKANQKKSAANEDSGGFGVKLKKLPPVHRFHHRQVFVHEITHQKAEAAWIAPSRLRRPRLLKAL
jgi:hypothetical protein